jgi:hypothetical protein
MQQNCWLFWDGGRRFVVVCYGRFGTIASVLKGQAVQVPQTRLRRRIIAESKATKLGSGQVEFTFVEENGLAAGSVYEAHINGVYPR